MCPQELETQSWLENIIHSSTEISSFHHPSTPLPSSPFFFIMRFNKNSETPSKRDWKAHYLQTQPRVSLITPNGPPSDHTRSKKTCATLSYLPKTLTTQTGPKNKRTLLILSLQFQFNFNRNLWNSPWRFIANRSTFRQGWKFALIAIISKAGITGPGK